ncbi:hypothetical protein B0H12DRAFT_335869 [Mycena haematopus]|nr:hypothetical protein B0H12DRAFT_335869 [Mycena haematopus]
MASTPNNNFASAAAHSYQPFYLPREDASSVSDSSDAAKRECSMATRNGDESIEVGSTMHSPTPCGSSVVVPEGETTAGKELNRELAEEIKRHRQEMAILQQELKDAFRVKDEETEELKVETRQLQAEMERVQNDLKKLASDYTAQKAELEKRMAEVVSAARKDAESAEENHRRQIKELEDRLHHSTMTSNSDKEDIQHRLSDLQRQYDEAHSQWRPRLEFLGKTGRRSASALHL